MRDEDTQDEDSKPDNSIEIPKVINPELESEPTLVYTDVLIDNISTDERVHNFFMEKFKRLTATDCEKLIRMVLEFKLKIYIKDFKKKANAFRHYNMSKIDLTDDSLRLDVLETLRKELDIFLKEITKDLSTYEEPQTDENIDEPLEKIDDICYKINKHSTYEMIRKLLCDEMGRPKFKYDFDNPDLILNAPKNNMPLQRARIQILSTGVKFDYPLIYKYLCPKCKTANQKKVYEVIGSKNKLICEGVFETFNAEGEKKLKPCLYNVYPDTDIGSTKDAFYFNISYEDPKTKNKPNAFAFSFKNLEPGFYECVLFRIKNPKGTELYLVMDVREIIDNKFNVPEKVEGENYIITLQKTFDKYIHTQTNMKIYGLLPIKVSLIIQKLFNVLNRKLISNVQIVGDAGTGKSLVLEYYGFLLNNNLNLSTNGLSISVPSLRGTRQTLTLMNKEIKLVTVGYLGTYHTIHIDEAGENKELVQNLKTFLLADNYSYDRAGGTGVFNVRTAHANLSQNLDNEHIGRYRGLIRKSYRNSNIKIGDEEKPAWDESFDLFLPLYEYTDNLYLRKVIKEKRMELQQKSVWWIDGFDYPLHERFPFYFYLVKNSRDRVLEDAMLDNIQMGNVISEHLELIKSLKSNTISEMFDSFTEFKKDMEERSDLIRVDDVLKSYSIPIDGRTRIFYHNVAIISRIVNKRNKMNKEDYDLVAWIIENTNRKIDVAETSEYTVKGAPDLDKDKAADIKIEEETEDVEEFGFGEDAFEV